MNLDLFTRLFGKRQIEQKIHRLTHANTDLDMGNKVLAQDLRIAYRDIDAVTKSRDEWRDAAYDKATKLTKTTKRLEHQEEHSKFQAGIIDDLIAIVTKEGKKLFDKDMQLDILTRAKDLFYKNWIDTVSVLESVTRENERWKQRNATQAGTITEYQQMNANQMAMIDSLTDQLTAERMYGCTQRDLAAALSGRVESVDALLLNEQQSSRWWREQYEGAGKEIGNQADIIRRQRKELEETRVSLALSRGELADLKKSRRIRKK